MGATLIRAGALGCVFLAIACLAAPALAQTSAPQRRAVDANGVDLISGTFPFTFTEGTIGSGEGAISVERHGNDPGGTGNWQNMYAYQAISGSTTTVTLILGDRAESFTRTGGSAFTPREGNGATLTGGNHSDFIYTGADGITMTFGAPVEDQNGASNLCSHVNANQNGCYALPTGITRPNGATIAFGWDVHANCGTQLNENGSLDCTYAWRLDTIGNSFGYAVDFSYVSNSVNLHQNPSGNWFKRNGATLSNGGTTRSVSYDFVSSTVTDITDADGRVWRMTNGTNALGIRRPGSSSDDISVAFSGGIVTQVVRDGVTTGYARSLSGSNATTTITNALNQATIVVADTSLARIVSVTDPLNRQIQYQYDSNGRPTRVTRPEGDYIALTYDSRGNVTETRAVAKSGSSLPDMIASATYASSCDGNPSCNQPLTTTDARGNVTEYDYDEEHGGLLSVTAPAPGGSGDQPQVRYAYAPAFGETGPLVLTEIAQCQTGTAPSCEGTANEAVTALGYDDDGNVDTVTRRNGTSSISSTATATYDGIGNLLTLDGPAPGNADTTRYRYNSARQVIGVIGPDPDGGGSGNPLHHPAVRTTYRSDGQPTKVERGTVASQSDGDWASFSTQQEVQAEYDTHHRPIVSRLVSGSTAYGLTQTSYDDLGRVRCVAQRMNEGQFATVSLPSDACTLDTEGSHGPDRIARTTYDNAGQPILVQSGYGVSGVAADEAAATYTANGRVETLTDAEGNRTTYVYDGHDRLSRTRMPHPSTDNTSSTTDYEELTYETLASGTRASPLVASRLLRDGNSIGFSYDHLGRLTVKDVPARSDLTSAQTRDVHYAYDLLGRLTHARFDSGSGEGVAFTYDALGRQLTSSIDMGGTTRTLSYGYDAAGNRNSLTWPDSVSFGVHHDALGRPGLLGGGIAYIGYGDNGAPNGISRANGIMTWFGQDGAQRLSTLRHFATATGDVQWTLGYNPAGQISSHSRDNDNYAWAGHYGVNRAYTTNGRNQYITVGDRTYAYDDNGNLTSDGERTWLYDNENRLVGAGAATLAYDPLGRLFSLTAPVPAPGTGNFTTTFLFDGGNLVAEYSGATTLRRHLHWGALDTPALTFDGAGFTLPHWLHADERGTIVASSDGNGAATINRYDEYGLPASANSGRFGFTGQIWLPEIGLYYYRARIYSPSLGRFMQTDPIGYEGGINLYAYVGNEPVNRTDPSGLQAGTSFSSPGAAANNATNYYFHRPIWVMTPYGPRQTVGEWAGGIYRYNGFGGTYYFYTANPGGTHSGSINPSDSVCWVYSCEFVAGWHVHNSNPHWSPEDYGWVRRHRSPLYMGYNGVTQRIDPTGAPRTNGSTRVNESHYPYLVTLQDMIIGSWRSRFGPGGTMALITYLLHCVVGEVDICEGTGPGIGIAVDPREVPVDPGTDE